MARPFWRHHQAVDIGTRLDKIEMHVQAMGKGNSRARTDVVMNFVTVNIGLQLVGRQHHYKITPGSGLGHIHDFKAGSSSLCTAGRVSTQRNSNLCNTAILQIGGMGMALTAITDNHDFLLLDQADVGISIVIDSHGLGSP